MRGLVQVRVAGSGQPPQCAASVVPRIVVACAETLTATLLTLDERLAREAPVSVQTLPST
jgi:hypothetical protein